MCHCHELIFNNNTNHLLADDFALSASVLEFLGDENALASIKFHSVDFEMTDIVAISN